MRWLLRVYSAGRGGVRAIARSMYGCDETKRGHLQATTRRDIRLRPTRAR